MGFGECGQALETALYPSGTVAFLLKAHWG